MKNTGYNLRQRPFPISTTADSLATIATSSVSTNVMAYPSSTGSATAGTGSTGPNSAPTNKYKVGVSNFRVFFTI